MGASKLVLIVIDGLTPKMLEDAVERKSVPALAFLKEHGKYRRAITAFPSLTPVCLASLATGAHPDVHGIPHLVWFHRGEQRLVEYGSSFGAIRAIGARRSIRDAVFSMNEEHLSRRAVTLYEAPDDAGLGRAAGAPDAFLDRYAVVLCSDHGQTRVERIERLQDSFAGFRLFRRGNGSRAQLAVTASNRAGMVYRLPGCGAEPADLAQHLDGGE